jgi:beta-1,4-mannosyltransferase
VLPYVASFNSGAAWLALSFDRPVLAPALGSFVELRDELGPRWVCTYEGTLDPETIQRALQRAAEVRDATVDLSASNWDAIGAAAVSAYQSVRKT